MTSESSEGPWQEARPPRSEFRWAWSPAQEADLDVVHREFRGYAMELLLGRPGGERAVEDAMVALQALMTNALRHGGPPIEVTVGSLESGLLLVVKDGAGDAPPAPRSAEDTTERRGLRVVADASESRGWCPEPAGGKSVWAFVPVQL